MNPPFPLFDPEQLSRFEARLATLRAVRAMAPRPRELAQLAVALGPELEELESGSSILTALDLLDAIERVRRAALSRDDAVPRHDRTSPMARPGGLVCHWPGRSLATGEAEIASRGFFDGLDRPPLLDWLEAIGRRSSATGGDFEVAIVAWVPEEDLERARAGCRACIHGSLALLDDVASELAHQLDPILQTETSR